ncbi:hypothetical protein [Blastococcus sp. SYSU D00695]
MYARSTTINASTAAIDAGITYMREEAMPAIQQMHACTGLSLLVDRDTGRCIATSAWADEAAMRASAPLVHPMRERLVATFGGEPEVREWEIDVLHREHTLHDGGAARLTWAHLDGPLEPFLEGYRTRLMPKLEELPGFCSVSLLVDRAGGRLVGTVSFDSRAALEATREQARALREGFTGTFGATVLDVAEMDVALAHLRVPETV